mgnify:CR=1 FL=1
MTKTKAKPAAAPAAKFGLTAAEWQNDSTCSRCGVSVAADAGPLLRAWKAEHERECWG